MSGYLQILKAECAAIVPENEFKSYVIARDRQQYDFEPGDRIAGFARSNDMKLRGHTLLWNRVEYLPKWLLSDLDSADAAQRYLRQYIQRVCSHSARVGFE